MKARKPEITAHCPAPSTRPEQRPRGLPKFAKKEWTRVVPVLVEAADSRRTNYQSSNPATALRQAL